MSTVTMMMLIFEPHPKYSLYHLPPWASCLNTAGLLVSTLASVRSDGCFSKVNQILSPSCSHPSEALTMANMPAKSHILPMPQARSPPPPWLPCQSWNLQSPSSRALALALPSALPPAFSRSWLRSLPHFTWLSAQVAFRRASPDRSI